MIGKEILNYTAIAGETILENEEGAQTASIFSISYIKEGGDRPEIRPITFLFNGGPGSSAVWLHLGAFGPRRISLSNDPVNPGSPPYELADNPNTLLRYSDLVFVDPVGTGFSRALGKSKDKDYWGVDEDSAILAQFIRSYLTNNKRWNSPKYLAGESYGTIRASVLIRDLELKLLNSVAFNGVVLISVALDVRTFLNPGPGTNCHTSSICPPTLPPRITTTPCHSSPQTLTLSCARPGDSAFTEYLVALFEGLIAAGRPEQAIMRQKLHAQFTGLSTDYLLRCHLRHRPGPLPEGTAAQPRPRLAASMQTPLHREATRRSR